MAEYLTNDTDLKKVADAIRTKGKTSAELLYPDGYVSAIEAITTGAELKIVVSVATGSAVTATKGELIVSGVSIGDSCTLVVPEPGTWDIKATLNEQTSDTKSISVVASYATVLRYPNIYGVEWDWTSNGSTQGTRTDAAASFDDPSPAVSNGSGSSPFDNLMPWSGMVKETRAGGVEVKEPKYWFKWTKTGKKLKLQIADGYVEGFSVDPVNRDRGDGLGELDFSYIGRYHCDNDYKSTTGTTPKGNVRRSVARDGIHNLGSNFWQMDFAQYWYIGMLFLVEFADWNGERIGRGCSDNYQKVDNGQTDAMNYHTGTTAATRNTYGYIQYRNIEGWWDNVFDWIDGCYYSDDGLHVINSPNEYSDSENGTLVGKPVDGYPTDLTIPTASGFEWALFSGAGGGSLSTYVPDYWNFNSSYPCLEHGGSASKSQNYGPFYVNCFTATGAGSSIGCRLQERPPRAA